ncbi:hypothetical protein ACIHEJ_01445 [Streptomyces sp. NPDC052301]|uniref:hypothetical protein n=1 Tax=Streptomyces sp. NPDC052301 TaxID=3365687 RepID=UPI0037D48E62
MRNQRALAAACSAAAALGLATTAAVANGPGGGGPSTSHGAAVVVGRGTGVAGTGVAGTGVGGTGVRAAGVGGFTGDGRGDVFGGRGDDFGHPGGGNGPGDDLGGLGDGSGPRDGPGNDFGGRDGGVLPDIVVTPGVLPAGAGPTVTVNGCRGGVMTSRGFRTAPLTPVRDDLSRGVAVIDRGVRPGRYDHTVRCDGRALTHPAAFTVLGAVQGGLGGGSTTGATPADLAVGGGLVASAVVAGGVFRLRRRHEKRS